MALDTSKIIHAPIGGGRYTVTAPIVKEDYGLYLLIEGLELPSTYEVDFSNSEHNGTSVTMIGNADGVLIPSQFISSGKDVFAFLYHVGVDFGRTVYKFRIPNKLRPDRTEEQPTPEEQSVIDQTIAALNVAVEQTAQDKADADASAQSASADAERAEEARTDAQNYATQAEQATDDAQTYANNASASATASAQSAEASARCSADAQDSAEEAQGYASASAQSASASANSASQASASATSASQSATSAQGYASQAQTSAQTASAKAGEASTSAQTASQKATESAQSASQALTYKTDAESAKTASQTAQGLAESARDSAISAQESAEDARDEAQALVDGISGKVEQIDSNTERIESLEDDRYKPYAVDTASGAVASFSDGADNIPLKSLIVNIDPVQDTSSGDPSPENICPISGWEGMNLKDTGKNMLDPTTYGKANASNYNKNAGTVLSVSGGNTTVEGENPILITNTTNWRGIIYTFTPKLGVTYRLSYRVTGETNANIKRAIYIINDNGTVVSRLWQSSAVDSSETYVYRYGFTVTESGQRFAFAIESSTAQMIRLMDLQIEVVTSAESSYEPYNGTTIPISWQTEAGTVYGGTLDVLSGVLTVTHTYQTFDGDEPWSAYGERSYRFPANTRWGMPKKKTGTNNVICDAYEVVGYNSNDYIAIVGYREVYPTAQDLKDALAQNPAHVCYELETPIEIQLDGHTLNSLYGQNNIFADTGDVSCEYRADTTLYISRLTEPDADMIADANITSGSYFMVGNNLYLATANIASGAQVIVGTNCTRKSLSEALNEINA